jgi:hypothetical protein
MLVRDGWPKFVKLLFVSSMAAGCTISLLDQDRASPKVRSARDSGGSPGFRRLRAAASPDKRRDGAALGQQPIPLGFQSPDHSVVPFPHCNEQSHRLASLSLTLGHGLVPSMSWQSFSFRDLKDFNYPESTADPLGISTNHFSREGKRTTWDSNSSISFGPTLTPLEYGVSMRTTSGCSPSQVIVRAKPNTASIESSSEPFQCISDTPQHRSIGLYLLWYGG